MRQRPFHEVRAEELRRLLEQFHEDVMAPLRADPAIAAEILARFPDAIVRAVELRAAAEVHLRALSRGK